MRAGVEHCEVKDTREPSAKSKDLVVACSVHNWIGLCFIAAVVNFMFHSSTSNTEDISNRPRRTQVSYRVQNEATA
jgi:hypothetical protein